MSEERLKEIKDSIDFQLIGFKEKGWNTELIDEEMELYNEVIRLRELRNIKPMEYKSDICRELLYKGTYKGFNYYVMSMGTHPTAYVEIPKKHKYYKKDYFDIDINVHGGLTYSNDSLYISDDIENSYMKKSWFIGWDYAHCDDYYGAFHKDLNFYKKKWTTEEIIEECKNVIEQII